MFVTSLYFLVILETIDTSETILIYMLVDFRVIGTFVNQSFVNKHQLNMCKLSHSISVYNVNDIPNKTGKINEVVNIVLYYKSLLRVDFASSL